METENKAVERQNVMEMYHYDIAANTSITVSFDPIPEWIVVTNVDAVIITVSYGTGYTSGTGARIRRGFVRIPGRTPTITITNNDAAQARVTVLAAAGEYARDVLAVAMTA